MDKTLKNKHIKSMLLWIITNKKMSVFQKSERILGFLFLRIAQILRQQDRRCILLVFFYTHQFSAYEKLLRRTELLMKRGYKVRLDISWSEKAPLHIDSECSQVLDQLINLLNQQKW